MADVAGWFLFVFGAFGGLCGAAGLLHWGRQDSLAIWWFAFGLLGSEFVAPMIPLGLAGAAVLAGLGASTRIRRSAGAVCRLEPA